jgi:hypothetical protein
MSMSVHDKSFNIIVGIEIFSTIKRSVPDHSTNILHSTPSFSSFSSPRRTNTLIMGGGFSLSLAEQELQRPLDGSDLQFGKEAIEVARIRWLIKDSLAIAKHHENVAKLIATTPALRIKSLVPNKAKALSVIVAHPNEGVCQAPTSPLPVSPLAVPSSCTSSNKSSARSPRSPLLGLTDNWANVANRKAKAAVVAAFANMGATGGLLTRAKARSHLSLSTQRWQDACHQVVMQLAVDKMRCRWEDYQQAQRVAARRQSGSWRERFNIK